MSDAETLATALILASALLHALWNAALKRTEDRDAVIGAVNLLGAIGALPFLMMVPLPTATDAAWISISVLVHLLYQLSLARMLGVADYSLGYPIARGIGPIAVVAATIWIIGEPLEPEQLFAIAFIALGAVASGLAAEKGRLTIPDAKSIKWAAWVGLLIGSYTFIDALSVKRMSVATFFLWSNILIAPFMLYTLHRINGPEIVPRIKKAILPGVPIICVAYGGYTLALFAFQKGSIYEIAALRETSIVFAVFVGAIWLKEAPTKLRVLGVCFIAAGAVGLKLL